MAWTKFQPRFLAKHLTCCKSDAPCRYTSLFRTLERRIDCSTLLAERLTIGARRVGELFPGVQGQLPVEPRSADAKNATLHSLPEAKRWLACYYDSDDSHRHCEVGPKSRPANHLLAHYLQVDDERTTATGHMYFIERQTVDPLRLSSGQQAAALRQMLSVEKESGPSQYRSTCRH